MISPQPHGLWKYLGKKQYSLPQNISRKLYLSWEDALWDLLRVKNISTGSIILLPNFFCMDVVGNMENHGLTCVFYPVDQSFQTEEKILSSYILEHKPRIIVIFHAAGIDNQLLKNKSNWLVNLSDEQILIEDCVHQVVDPTRVRIVRENHFVIDSLQKVLPLPGSFIYGAQHDLDFEGRRSVRTLPYELSVLFWWLLMQLMWELKLFTFGERLMLKAYEVIGDNMDAGYSPGIVERIHRHIDFEKIRKTKRKQVKVYQYFLAALVKKFPNIFFSISLGNTDPGELRGYPLGIFLQSKISFLRTIRAKGLLLREELADSPWSKDKRVVYLPLGSYLSMSDVERVTQTISSALIQ